jgi:hypothetical protein
MWLNIAERTRLSTDWLNDLVPLNDLFGSWLLCWRDQLPISLAGIALAAPAPGAERCMATDPTGSPLNVRRFDDTVIGVLHNGKIVRILRTGADENGKPWAHVAYETNGEGWVCREFISCYLKPTKGGLRRLRQDARSCRVSEFHFLAPKPLKRLSRRQKCTDRRRAPRHSHSIVPGGFEVTS